MCQVPPQEKGTDWMTMESFKTYVSIFVRTFAALATTALLAAQGYDWASGDYRTNATQLAFALLVALAGGLIAAGWAFVRSPAVTAMDKAVRSAVQWILGSGVGVVVNSFADFVTIGKLVVPAIIGAVLAFAVTYFANQGTVPPATVNP
jgi:hypothetical protein